MSKWQTKDGQELEIAEMETSHIQNCIRLIERKWDDLDPDDDYISADHWSQMAVVFVPGKPYFEEKLKELRAELSKRKENHNG